VVLIKSAPRVPEHQQTLSAEGRRAAAKREQAAQRKALAPAAVENRAPVRAGAHWPAEMVNAQPRLVTMQKDLTAGSMRHLTAEGRRAAQMRLPKAQQRGDLRAQGSGPRRSGPVPVEHESVRLRHVEQQRKASDAESDQAERRARQEKFALEQRQEEIVREKMQLAIATDPDSYAANAAFARQIASKQSGAAVNHIFSAGYGYEDPAKQSGAAPRFEVRAPWD